MNNDNENPLPDHTSVISIDPKYGSLREHLLQSKEPLFKENSDELFLIRNTLPDKSSKIFPADRNSKLNLEAKPNSFKENAQKEPFSADFSFKNVSGPVDKESLTRIIQKELSQIHISCKDLKGLIQQGAEKSGFWCIKPHRVHELAELIEEDVDISDSLRKCERRQKAEGRLLKVFTRVFNALTLIIELKRRVFEKKRSVFAPSSKENLLKPKETHYISINSRESSTNSSTFCERLVNSPRLMLFFCYFVLSLAAIGVFLYGFFMPEHKFKKTCDFIGIGLQFAFAGKIGVLFIVDAMFFLMFRDVLTFLRKFRLFGKYFNVFLNEHVTLHKFCGYILAIFATIHAIGHLSGTFVKISQTQDLVALNSLTTVGKFDKIPTYSSLLFATIPGITGIIMLVIIYMIVLSSLEPIKRKYFQVFGYSHVLYLVFCVVLYVHGCMYLFNYGLPYAVAYVTPFLCVGLLHHLKKWWQLSLASRVIDVSFSAKNAVAYIKIQKPRGFNVTPGQYLFLNVPSIAYFQWHPFSICSIGENGVVKLMVKNAGDFTGLFLAQLFKAKSDFIVENNLEIGNNKKFQQLYYDFLLKEGEVFEIVSKNVKNDEKLKENKGKTIRNTQKTLPKYPKVGLYGPISAPAVGAFNNKNVVFIGSGVGISPYIVFLDEYINFLKRERSNRKKLRASAQKNMETASFNRDIMLNAYKTSKFLSEIRLSKLQSEQKSEDLRIFFENFEKISFYYVARDCDQLTWLTFYVLKLIKYGYNREKLDIKLFLTTPKEQIKDLQSFLFWRALDKYQKKRDGARIKSCVDFLTNLPMQVIYKRPEFEKYFRESLRNQKVSKDFYVYACGPEGLLKSIAEACEKVNKVEGKGAKFVFFPEKF